MKTKVPSRSMRAQGSIRRITLAMRSSYASALFENPGATTDDLREAVTTLEDTEPTAKSSPRRAPGKHNCVNHAKHAIALRTARSRRRRRMCARVSKGAR